MNKTYTIREAHISYKKVGTVPTRKAEGPEEVCKYMTPVIEQDPFREHLFVIPVDTRHNIIGFHRVAIGTINEAIAHPREIMRVVLMTHGAYAFILCHNHPSGDAAPSDADVRLTRRIDECAKLLQTPLLDHVILGNDSMSEGCKYYSFKDAGIL